MMSDGVVSVILPIHNVGKYLRQALDSIISQTYKKIEVILVDDGSTDESSKIVDQYANKFSNFRVFHLKKGGVAEARNFGLKQSRGEYIYFMDPDDWIESNLFEVAISSINKDGTDAFLMNFSFVNEDGNYIKKNRNVRISVNPVSLSQTILKEILLNNIQGYVWQFVIKKKIIANSKMMHTFQNIIYEDVIWTPKMVLLTKKISISKDYFYNYRQRTGSIVHTFTGKSIRDRQFGINYLNNLVVKECPDMKKYIAVWNLITMIHIYSMCTRLTSESAVKLRKQIRKKMLFNRGFVKLRFVDKLRYLLIISNLFGLISNLYRKVNRTKI